MANTITPLNRNWYGLVYFKIRLNNRVSNAFAFILFGASSCYPLYLFICGLREPQSSYKKDAASIRAMG